ncbi:RecT family recombinase [Paenibacillus sp. NPDC058367]|uniref:RecT family recombinase n=1 Tax=Paenibacillus sp. NPDC058367 TaxID=3346460 RepID=UPI00365F129D
MAKNQLATYTPEIAAAFQPEVLEVIRTSICPTANDAEFLLFAHKAASYGLDPFKNEIFFIKYGNQARIQFAAEAYLAKAREKDGFQPPDTQMVCDNDVFKARKNPDTKEIEIVEHEIGFPRGEIIGAYSITYRDGYRPVTVLMDRSEIQHMFSGQNKDNWNKWTSDMFGKHVELRGLKKQYGLEFGDEDTERQPQSNSFDPKQRTDVTPTSADPEVIDTGGTKEFPKQQGDVSNDDDRLKQARADMKKKFTQLGVTDKAEMAEHMNKYCKMKGDVPTLQELTGYLKVMDLQIAEKQAAQAQDDDLPE